MAESKQVRIDAGTLDQLGDISEVTGWTRGHCNAMVVDIFAQIFTRLGDTGRLIVENEDGTRTEVLVPGRSRTKRRKPQSK